MHAVDIELVQHAKPKGCKLRGTATLGYSRRESAPGSCCICAILGQGARFPNTDVEGVGSPKHHILGRCEVFPWNCKRPFRRLWARPLDTMLCELHFINSKSSLRKLCDDWSWSPCNITEPMQLSRNIESRRQSKAGTGVAVACAAIAIHRIRAV